MLTDIILPSIMVDDEIDEHELSSYKYFGKFIFLAVILYECRSWA